MMGLISGEEFIKRVLSRPRKIYVLGEEVANPYEHPVIRPITKSIEKVYDLTLKPEYDGILTANGIENEKISRFLHIDKSREDLILRLEAMKIVNTVIGDCNYRCTGHDALNALFPTTYEIDREYGTDYHIRLKKYIRMIQRHDLLVLGAMTDPKGDRSKSPKDQPVKDVYLHVVEERRDGIIVRGSKMHVSGAMVADELIVLPTKSFKKNEEEYAVSFAVPTDADGLYFISSWNNMDALYKVSKELGIDLDIPSVYGHRGTGLIIFDNVFIPKDRIFMLGETEYTGKLITYFIAHHRGGGAGCKAGFARVIIGATALMAELNGILDARGIREKLTEMKYHGDAVYASGIAAAYKGIRHESGAYIPDITFSNIAKLEAVNHLKEVIMLAADVGGGIITNAPSGKDLDIPKLGNILKNILRAKEEYKTEDRLKAAKLLQNWTAGIHLVGLIQGGGPPSTSMIYLARLLKNELPELLDNAKRLARIEEKG